MTTSLNNFYNETTGEWLYGAQTPGEYEYQATHPPKARWEGNYLKPILRCKVCLKERQPCYFSRGQCQPCNYCVNKAKGWT